jgi:hypothetical protein
MLNRNVQRIGHKASTIGAMMKLKGTVYHGGIAYHHMGV